MAKRRAHLISRRWCAGAILVALALRAYVPVGFMPGSSPFALEVCPQGMGATMHLHHADHGGHDAHEHFAHCPFGGMMAAGPCSHGIAALAVQAQDAPLRKDFSIAPQSSRLRRAQAARAPPVLV